MNERVSKERYYLDIARDVATRSTCLRSCYGAVIVNHDEIISTGYNGAPRGRKNCVDCGYCIRTELGLSKGERYELCRSVHAEANAIISADRNRMIGGKLYLSGFDPQTYDLIENIDCCAMCKRMIINAGISKVIFDDLSSISTYRSIEPYSWVLIDDVIPSKELVIKNTKFDTFKLLDYNNDLIDEKCLNYDSWVKLCVYINDIMPLFKPLITENILANDSDAKLYLESYRRYCSSHHHDISVFMSLDVTKIFMLINSGLSYFLDVIYKTADIDLINHIVDTLVGR